MVLSTFIPINPHFLDLVFILFFPNGTLTIENNVIILIPSFLWYIFSILMLKFCKCKMSENWNEIKRYIILILLTGIWVNVVAIFLTQLFLLRSITNINKIEKTNKSKDKQILLGLFKILSGAIFFFYIPGFSYNIYTRKRLYVAIYQLLGFVITNLYILMRYLKNKNKSNNIRNFSIKPLNRIKISALLLILLCSASIYAFRVSDIRVNVEFEPNLSEITTELKIVSYNIRYASENERNPADNWSNRKNPFVEYVDSIEADIIGVQEALYEQLVFMQENLQFADYRYTGFGRIDGALGDEFSAIFYRADKFNYIIGDTFWFSNTPSFPSRDWDTGNHRICTWALFETIETSSKFFVFNTHYGFSQEFREKASPLINEKIVQYSEDLPVFLIGDFNLKNYDPEFQLLENYGEKPLKDSFVLYHDGDPFDFTFNQFNSSFVPDQPRRIDFILISEHITPTFTIIPKDTYGDSLVFSDHYPVILECYF